MANKTKEELILAVSETIERVGEPLQNYISSSKDNLNHFIDVTMRNEREPDNLHYDVLDTELYRSNNNIIISIINNK